MPALEQWIKEKAADSLQPAQVETSLRHIAESWPDAGQSLVEIVEQFPLGRGPLLHLLSVSAICTSRLQRNPGTFLWLSHPDVSLSRRSSAQMINDLRAFAGDAAADDNFRLLRVWKGREMTRVALREIANVAPFEETT